MLKLEAKYLKLDFCVKGSIDKFFAFSGLPLLEVIKMSQSEILLIFFCNKLPFYFQSNLIGIDLSYNTFKCMQRKNCIYLILVKF